MNRMKITLILTMVVIAGIYIAAAQTGSVTDLKNVSYAPNYIKWTWKDPTDNNFSRVMIYINGAFKTNVTKGIENYNATNLKQNTDYSIGTRTVDKKGNISSEWKNDSARTLANITDKVPPSSITGLKNVTYAPNYIKWTWNDPSSTDFAKVMIYINGAFETNVTKGVEDYNATGLNVSTSYTIGTHTVDTSGNINNTWVNNSAKTAPKNSTNDTIPPSSITDLKNVTYAPNFIKWTWNDPSSTDFAKVMIYINGEFRTNVTNGIENYNATDLNEGTEYTIGTHAVDDSGNINNTWVNKSAKTSVQQHGPKITVVKEPENLDMVIGESLFFNVRVDQGVNITWKVDNTNKKSEDILEGRTSNFTFKPSAKGDYNISVIAKNNNGTDTKNWSVAVHSKTFRSGNRIWDGSKPKEYSLTYTWNPMSFSGFYYNINNDVGDESITITLDNYNDRNINDGDMIYSTTPDEVTFGFSDFGKYQVIGFMADKYFAGYTDNTKPPKPKESVKKISVIGQGQLHKVLLDDDQKRTLTVGSSVTLKEGYVIKAKDVGDRTMLISLLKDGGEVDSASLLSAGETYVYKKRVGSVDDLPLIMVKFDSVFIGKESQMAILKGMFQISEDYAKIENGDSFGAMEITEKSSNKIAMENKNSISLSSGNIVGIMGDLKIIVADSDDVRFALFADKKGNYDIRGTIYPATDEWTPMNFGQNVGKKSIGFYYDIDDDIGTEKFTIDGNITGRSISKGQLTYSTSPQEVSFNHDDFGSYSVIGFMADKYFAGYTENSTIDNDAKSAIGSGQLHKVLLDDDEQRVIAVGSTLTLKDGYTLKAKEIDVGVGTGQIWVTLLKDGNEIDDSTIESGENYIYSKKSGGVDDLPIIAAHISSVFRGKEVNAAFIKGVFQISDNYIKLDSGDDFGVMEIAKTGEDEIVMENKNSISLSSGNTVNIMGVIKFRVADRQTLRFYPYVTVTPEMVENQLIIDIPSKVTAGDTITIKVTTANNAIEGASISIDPGIGLIDNKTNINGTISYTIPKTLKGTYNITATKLGYEDATKNIEILEYIVNTLSIDIPVVTNQFETMTILIVSNNTPISGVSITYDNKYIGSTDNNGKLNYTLDASGTHTIAATKSGYISVSREIEVKMPFSEFDALDISIMPESISTGDKIVVRSNITNIGTKRDSIPVLLTINDSEVDSQTVTLSPKEIKEINFTYKIPLQKGNYTVQIIGQEKMLEVKDREGLGVFAFAGILTVILAIIIYIVTTKKDLRNLLKGWRKDS